MIDPGTLAANLLQKNFHKFGSFRKLCNYKSMPDSSYNTTTGVVTVAPTSETAIYIIFDEFSFTMTQASTFRGDETKIESTDRKAIFPSLDLAVKPKMSDLIVDDEGATWRVMGKSLDPKPAHYELHVRPIDV